MLFFAMLGCRETNDEKLNDAAALYTCYRKASCSALSARLSDTERLLGRIGNPKRLYKKIAKKVKK